jgi:hypothetical protein
LGQNKARHVGEKETPRADPKDEQVNEDPPEVSSNSR